MCIKKFRINFLSDLRLRDYSFYIKIDNEITVDPHLEKKKKLFLILRLMTYEMSMKALPMYSYSELYISSNFSTQLRCVFFKNIYFSLRRNWLRVHLHILLHNTIKWITVLIRSFFIENALLLHSPYQAKPHKNHILPRLYHESVAEQD